MQPKKGGAGKEFVFTLRDGPLSSVRFPNMEGAFVDGALP